MHCEEILATLYIKPNMKLSTLKRILKKIKLNGEINYSDLRVIFIWYRTS